MVTDGNRLRPEWSAEAVRGLLPSSLLQTESPKTDDQLPPATASGLRPASGERGRLLPSVSSEQPSSEERSERTPTARLRERLPTVALGDRVSRPDIRGRFPRPAVRERVPTAALGDRLSAASSTAGVGDRVSMPEIDRDLSAPPVALPDSDDIVGREDIEAHVYDTQTTKPEYFVGVIPATHDTVVEQLADSEFSVSRITYPKTLPDDIDYDESSIWVYRSWALSHFQLHVPLFEIECDGGPVVFVFYHHEYNWLRHPVNHLDAEYLNPDWERDAIVDLIEATGLTVETCADIDGEYGPAADYCATCSDNT